MKTLKNFVIYSTSFVIAFFAVSFAKQANAEVIARLKNDNGGFIYFTNDVCKTGGQTFKNLQGAYTKTTDGKPVKGCYAVDEVTQEVKVLWFEVDGEPIKVTERIYDIADIELRQSEGAKKSSSKAKTVDI